MPKRLGCSVERNNRLSSTHKPGGYTVTSKDCTVRACGLTKEKEMSLKSMSDHSHNGTGIVSFTDSKGVERYDICDIGEESVYCPRLRERAPLDKCKGWWPVHAVAVEMLPTKSADEVTRGKMLVAVAAVLLMYDAINIGARAGLAGGVLLGFGVGILAELALLIYGCWRWFK